MVQLCLSQEGQNVIYFDVLEQIGKVIYFEKSLSDNSESSAFYKNVFNRASFGSVCVYVSPNPSQCISSYLYLFNISFILLIIQWV